MGGKSSSHVDLDDAALEANPTAHLKPPVKPDPGASVPGVMPGGGACSCHVPPINIKALHDQDKDHIRHLDVYQLRALVRQKPQSETLFGESFERFKDSRDRIDRAMAELVRRYTAFERSKIELQTAQRGARFVHMTRCRPLQEAYSLHLPCHEDYRESMETYRDLVTKPTCTVGASLPLMPASMAPASAADSVAAAAGAAAASAGCGAAAGAGCGAKADVAAGGAAHPGAPRRARSARSFL